MKPLDTKTAFEVGRKFISRASFVLAELKKLPDDSAKENILLVEDRIRLVKLELGKILVGKNQGTTQFGVTLVSVEAEDRLLEAITTIDLESILELAKGLVFQLEKIKQASLNQTELTSKKHDMLEVLSETQAAEFLGVATETLRRYRRAGIGPKYLQKARLVKYTKTSLVEWLKGST